MNVMNRYQKTAETKKLKYGKDWFAKQGAKGGRAKVDKGFAITGTGKEAANKRWIKVKYENREQDISVNNKI